MCAAPGLWAAGHAAQLRDGAPRVEHWRVAQQQGRVAAIDMASGTAGKAEEWRGVPIFWTAQHGKRLDYVGHADAWDSIEIDGELEAFEFIAWYALGGTVKAALTCGRETETARLAGLLRGTVTIAEAPAAVAAV